MNENIYDIVMVKPRQIVTGTIVNVKDKVISVDLKTFTEGTMYLEYYTLDKNIESFKEICKVGDEITCEVHSVDEGNGLILLSRLSMAKKEAFKDFINGNTSDPISVKVEKEINKGYMTSYNSIQFFLPKSEAVNVTIGKKVDVLIQRIDEDRNTGVVSQKALIQVNNNKKKEAEFSTLKVGDTITGEISRIENYGAFVKFGSLQGLIRLREINHKFVSNPNTVFKIGDTVTVMIISLENGRIDLSLRAMTKSPIELFACENKVSDKITVTVAQKMPFGIICNCAEDVTGLLHKNEFSWNPNDNLLANVKIGDSLEVAIIELDIDKKKVGLSRKALMDNPWSRVNASIGDEVTGVVSAISSKGLNVTALGVDGFIDFKDIKLEKSSSKLDDYYSVGDEITGIITKVDPKAWILNISQKAYQEIVERKQFEEYMNNQEEEETQATLGDIFKDFK